MSGSLRNAQKGKHCKCIYSPVNDDETLPIIHDACFIFITTVGDQNSGGETLGNFACPGLQKSKNVCNRVKNSELFEFT